MSQTDYFQRVRSLLGQRFFEARVAVWDLEFGYLAAEALARTGIRHQDWFDSGTAGGALCRSLGWQLAGQPRGEALARRCEAHNAGQSGWDLSRHEQQLPALQATLDRTPPQLLLARGGADAGAVARAAVDRAIPLVISFTPEASPAGVINVVWLPGSAADPGQVVRTCEELGQVASRDTDDPQNHVDDLEARSMALGLAKWILLRGARGSDDDGGPAFRPDLEVPIVQRGRAVVIRGAPVWPWAVGFTRPGPGVLSRLRGGQRYRPPLTLIPQQRLLVLGLGTASLLCAEAGLLFDQMVFVDCKEVSPYNPVRQVYGTEHVGRAKPEALVEIMRQRADPGASWEATEAGPAGARMWRTSSRALGAMDLRLRQDDGDSVERFGQLLEEFRPTMVVVGMGRSKDDNFTATYELRRRGIPHITPTAFPAVTHFKHILTEGSGGPCYDCLQGHLPLDGGAGPTLDPEVRELFYGGTQPATLAETLPSAHSLLRLTQDLSLPGPARPVYLMRELADERNCFVGSNQAELASSGWLYGVDQPFSMVTFGVRDLVGAAARRRCSCGRVNVGVDGQQSAPTLC